MFELTDLVTEVLAGWLLASGLVWLALAVHRVRRSGLDGSVAALGLTALLGWVALLRLTTGVLGGREIIPLSPVHLAANGLPYYLLALLLALSAMGAARLARGSALPISIAAATSVLVPALALPLVVGSAPGAPLFSDRPALGVATPPPDAPIVDTAHPGMVRVPAGPFVMGSLSPEQLHPIVANAEGDEQPVRTVRLDGFYIDRLEVTNARFAAFVAETGYRTDAEREGSGQVVGDAGWHTQDGASWRHPMGPEDGIEGLDDHPVVQVSWNDADAFCAWDGKRLPTEAEWEKAARGIDGRTFPWGMEFDSTRLNFCPECDYAIVSFAAGPDGFARTAPVGSFPAGASPYGALDMAGNVWEWVSDWFDPDYYAYGPPTNPTGPPRRRAFRGSKSIRGGSWTSEPGKVRTASRSYDPPEWRAFGAGFRCASDG